MCARRLFSSSLFVGFIDESFILKAVKSKQTSRNLSPQLLVLGIGCWCAFCARPFPAEAMLHRLAISIFRFVLVHICCVLFFLLSLGVICLSILPFCFSSFFFGERLRFGTSPVLLSCYHGWIPRRSVSVRQSINCGFTQWFISPSLPRFTFDPCTHLPRAVYRKCARKPKQCI